MGTPSHVCNVFDASSILNILEFTCHGTLKGRKRDILQEPPTCSLHRSSCRSWRHRRLKLLAPNTNDICPAKKLQAVFKEKRCCLPHRVAETLGTILQPTGRKKKHARFSYWWTTSTQSPDQYRFLGHINHMLVFPIEARYVERIHWRHTCRINAKIAELSKCLANTRLNQMNTAHPYFGHLPVSKVVIKACKTPRGPMDSVPAGADRKRL